MNHNPLDSLSKREGLREYYHQQVSDLVQQAADLGIVITVSLKSNPRQPTAGVYRFVVETRHGRGSYLPEGVHIPPRKPEPFCPAYGLDYGAWPQISTEARRTGRTTRMMQHALARAQAGKRSIVVAYSHDYARDMRNRSWATPDGHSMWSARATSLGNRIRFISAQDWRVSVTGLRVMGIPGEEVLWSHEALEQSMRQHLLELHRFDGKLPEGAE